MKKRRKVFFILILPLIAIATYFVLVKSELTKLQEIIIQGASPTTEDRIRNKIQILIGNSIWHLDLDVTAHLIETDPWIKTVDLRRQLPKTLTISVVERRPVAVLGNGLGQFKYVDEYSFIIDKANSQEIGEYPVLMGKEFFDKKDLRAKALELIADLPQEGLVSKADLGDLRYSSEHGFQMTLSKTGILIDLGKENIPLHIDRVRRVVQYLDQHQVNAMHIDSDYQKKVLVKVRKGR